MALLQWKPSRNIRILDVKYLVVGMISVVLLFTADKLVAMEPRDPVCHSRSRHIALYLGTYEVCLSQ
jgi:hypothetical protein